MDLVRNCFFRKHKLFKIEKHF